MGLDLNFVLVISSYESIGVLLHTPNIFHDRCDNLLVIRASMITIVLFCFSVLGNGLGIKIRLVMKFHFSSSKTNFDFR